MDSLAGMSLTGRKIPGASADLIEVMAESGLKHTAVVFHDAYRDHPCLNGDLEVGMGFMEQPGVTGLARLVSHIPEEGAFLYPTGTVWSVAEIVRELSDIGEVGGTRAALELCYMAGEILVEASDQAVHSGLLGHGCVDPWRIVLKADGQVSVLGYGLPRAEIEEYLETEARLPNEDSLRYCAPENLAENPEHDLSSDLFTLCLVALELMVGKTVYDGLPADVHKQASRGEAIRRLYQWRDRIPETVREVLGKALKPDPDIRYRDGLDFVYSVHDLLGGIDAGDGPSLRALVTKVRARQKRGKAVVGGNTGALTKAELSELAADIDDDGSETDLPSPRRPRPATAGEEGDEAPRWKRSTRGAARAETATPPPAETRGRRRTRPSAEPEKGSARDRLLNRLRRPDEKGEPSRRRRRTSRLSEEPAQPRRAKHSEEADEAKLGDASEPQSPPAPTKRKPGGRAAALLERLRSTSGGEEKGASALTEVAKRVATAGRPDNPKSAPEPVEDGVEVTEVQAPARLEVPQATTEGATVGVAYDGPAIEVPLAGDAAAICSAAVTALDLPTTDLMGTTTATYRLLSKGKRVPQDTVASSISGPLQLERIPNSIVLVTITAEGKAPSKITTPLGTAVPVGLLKRALRDLLELHEGFELVLNGKSLPNAFALADVSLDDNPVLEVKW